MKSIHIAPDLSLPLDIVTQTIGVLAKRRAGKSYLLKRIVEQLFRASQQVVITDPKGDWWGIRSAADGKAPGLPIVIFGGERADVPLEAGAGELVAKLVVEERVSALLDLSLLRKHEVATFMTGFLENLYRLKAREIYRTPLMLAIDEADAIAPQRPMKGEERMLGAAEDIVRRGGQRGIGCAMATQRAAVLNKNVLTQVQILVALRTIAPQDLAALNSWIDVHGTEDQRATLMESLPSLPVGDAWFWSPGWPTVNGIFKRVHVLPIETFDSGATPKPGEKRVEPKQLADIDLDAVRAQMATTLERAKENDPQHLKKQLLEARREIGQLQKRAPVPAPAQKTKVVEKPVLKDGQLDRLEKLVKRAEEVRISLSASIAEIGGAIGAVRTAMNATSVRNSIAMTVPRPAPARAIAPKPRVESNGNGEVAKGAIRQLLTALAQHPEGLSYRKLGVFSGVSTKGGSFRTYLSRMRGSGWIEGDDQSLVRITDAGLQALGDYEPLPAGRELVDYWIKEFGNSKPADILRVVADAWPNALSHDEIGAQADVSIAGGSYRTYLSRLRSRDLIEGTREIRLAEDLAQ
jgi:hypothetical protein